MPRIRGPRIPRPGTARSSAIDVSDLVYLYGFVPSGTRSPDELSGIEERPVELFDLDGFLAVVSRVPAGTYAPEAVRAGLEDLDWVADRGVQHERVVTWFVDEEWILPARLLTLYSSEAALASEAAAGREGIESRLRELAGLREWNLKVSCDPERVRSALSSLSPEIAALDREIAEASPGRRYLLERRREGLVGEETARVARDLAGDLLDRARAVAGRTRILEPPADVEAGSMLLNAAFLCDSTAGEVLRREVEAASVELEAKGLDVGFSGPWAPYRFIDAGEDDA